MTDTDYDQLLTEQGKNWRVSLGVAASREQIAEDLEALIDKYWDLAYLEGNEGRTVDTPDGEANRTRVFIHQLIKQLTNPPSGG